MTCQAAVKRKGLRQCKRAAKVGGFCAKHAEMHERGEEATQIPVWHWPRWAIRLGGLTIRICGWRWAP